MLNIQLQKLIFHSHHGYYPEEQILGNEFEVSADIEVETTGQITTLRQTVNYVTVYNVIRQRMQQPTPLLETVAQELAQAIGAIDGRIKSVAISIQKLCAPIENFHGIVGVRYKTLF